MKTLIQLSVIIFLLLSSPAWPEYESHTHHHAELSDKNQVQGTQGLSCKNIIHVKINGLVCDFCARALEKVIGKRDDVLGIDVDLNNGKVSIAMKQGKTIDNKTLTKLITDSGYNLVSVKKGC